MITIKSILRHIALFLVCFVVIATGVYLCVAFSGQKTLHLDKKQWHPAKPESQHMDSVLLDKAIDYVGIFFLELLIMFFSPVSKWLYDVYV